MQAIGGTQRPSEAIRNHQRHSVAAHLRAERHVELGIRKVLTLQLTILIVAAVARRGGGRLLHALQIEL